MTEMDRKAKKKLKRKVLVSASGRYEMRIQAAHRHVRQIPILRVTRMEARGGTTEVMHLTGEELLEAPEEKYGPREQMNPSNVGQMGTGK